VLQTGALPVNFVQIERTDVSGYARQGLLNEAKKAALIGLLLVAVFLLVLYASSGWVAVIGLGIYAAFLYAAILALPCHADPAGIRGAHGLASRILHLDAFRRDDVASATRTSRFVAAIAGRVSVTWKQKDRGVEEGRVDAEADHRDQPEEAVEDEHGRRPPAAGRSGPPFFRLVEGVLAERSRRHRCASILDEVDGKAPVWSTSAKSFGLADRLDPGDLGFPRDPAGQVPTWCSRSAGTT